MPISFLLDSALGQLTAAFILPFAAPRSSGHRHSPRRAAPATAAIHAAARRGVRRSEPLVELSIFRYRPASQQWTFAQVDAEVPVRRE